MRKILVRFLLWRIKHLSDRNFIILLAAAVGSLAGLAAVVLKQSVHFIHAYLIGGFESADGNTLYVLYPALGIYLTVVVTRLFLKDEMGHGITEILYDISKRFGRISVNKTFSRLITSAITVGFGGSVGLEAPIVVTGSAIGSNVGQLVHLSYKQKTILIGAGAAGAIAGIFNSPIAGVIFAIEVMLADVTVAIFIPLLIAAVFGQLVSILLLGEDVLFAFELSDPFRAADLPFYILLGMLAGLFSVYFTRTTYKVESWIKRLTNDYFRALAGGLALGLIIFLLPPIYGEGYETIKLLLSGDWQHVLASSIFFAEIENIALVVLFLTGVVLIKPFASALTIGSGGSGGIFAPSLFTGGVLGFIFAVSSNVFLGTDLSVANFVLVGMGGTMSGILHAPLTAIFLIAEITSGYTLILPLMLVSAISYNAASYFEKYSFYTRHLVEKGHFFQHDKDRLVLSQINLSKIIERDLHTIRPESKLADLVRLVRISRRNIFPVVEQDGTFVGVITLDDIREIMFDKEMQENAEVHALMSKAPARVSPHENMQSIMEKFEQTGAWNLPVVEDGKYVGFLSKSSIFNSYRKKLIRHQMH